MFEELKSCPFCEGEAVIDIVSCPQVLYEQGLEDAYIRVVCLGCDAQTVDLIYGTGSEEDVTKLWNTRPPPFKPIDTLPNEYLHNEKLVMIKLAHGIVSAWFEPYREVEGPNGREGDGGMWIALDDDLQFEMDSVTHWAPMMEERK